MTRIARFAVFAIASLALAGGACTPLAPGETLMRHEKGDDTMVLQATDTGTYALYEWGSMTPRFKVPLKKGDTYGFRKAADGGKTMVVWGENSREYPEARYYWKLADKD